jgi:hypothetical protein
MVKNGKFNDETSMVNAAVGLLALLAGIIIFPSLSPAWQTAKPAASQGSSTSTQGVTFAKGTWSVAMPAGPNLVVLCYSLDKEDSAASPFGMQPTTITGVNCVGQNPLLQRQSAVVAVDMTHSGDLSRIAAFTFNLTWVASSPINPAAMRPSTSTASITTLAAAANAVYYFKWPVPLTGDTLPTLSVSVNYIGPAPGESRSPDTMYAAGSVVTAVPSNGHYYLATNEARSGAGSPTFTTVTPATVADPPIAGAGLTWMDLGTGTPLGFAAPFAAWAPFKQFAQGAVILNPLNGHFYAANVGGQSGASMPVFPLTSRSTVAEPVAGAVTWQEIGAKAPTGATIPQWSPGITVIAGQLINPLNGHFYMAMTSGQTGAGFPSFPTISRATVTEAAGAATPLTWTDLGTSVPLGFAPPFAQWSPNKQFNAGSVILNPINNHFYVANVGGQSALSIPALPVTTALTVSEPVAGPITWEDVGTAAPGGLSTTLSQWTPNTTFATGQVISNPDNGHYYLARVGGQSGPAMPGFPVTAKPIIGDGNVAFVDAGTVPPASVTSATATDQSVGLLNVGLPQVHTLYYFNLATGFAFSTVRNASYSRVPLAPGMQSGTEQYYTQQTRGSRTVEPILLFTVYLPKFAMDAESPWRPKNLIPGLSFGLSLTNPATSFYLGGTSEIWRNMQFAAGVNIAKVTRLSPNAMDPLSGAAPVTYQKFGTGAFIGLTLNLAGC